MLVSGVLEVTGHSGEPGQTGITVTLVAGVGTEEEELTIG